MYLDVAEHVVLDGGKSDGAQGIYTAGILMVGRGLTIRAVAEDLCTEDGGQGLGGIEEFRCGDGIGVVGIDGDVDEGFLEGIEEGAAGGNGCHCEGCFCFAFLSGICVI